MSSAGKRVPDSRMASEAAALGLRGRRQRNETLRGNRTGRCRISRNRAAAPLLKMPPEVKTDLAAAKADLAAVRVEMRWLFAFLTALLLLANARAYGLL